MLTEKWMKRVEESCRGQESRLRIVLGKAASITGIGCNVLLCAIKLLAGTISGSVAITADAVNNLSDASSSIISLLGFKLAERPADADHPYGHGRYEYLSGLMVAVMIMAIGINLLKSSVEKILTPTAVHYSGLSMAILLISILVKLWMAGFNRTVGKRIDSGTLLATADDSRNDVISTAAVLAAALISRVSGLTLDGYMGMAVAAFILISGFHLVKETIDPMLGSAPDAQQVSKIRSRIMSYPGVLGTHDLMVHDYGPGRQFASVHVEMSAGEDPLVSHEVIDTIEREFMRDEHLHLVVHYDPVVTDDERIPAIRVFLARQAERIHPEITIHDLRLVPGNTTTNAVFDCVVPYNAGVDPANVRKALTEAVRKEYPGYEAVITMERSFAGE